MLLYSSRSFFTLSGDIVPTELASRSTRRTLFTHTTLPLDEQIRLGGPCFEQAREVDTEEGSLVFMQAYNNDVPYGIIPGFTASGWSQEGTQRSVAVNPLTVAGQNKYHKMLSQLVKGNLYFW